ncbi:hypothetical protein [Phytohabitans kaempferiae]|uniref:Uncharacterized protein n=1 Tax=Phytohabitans kaempferiae TaxID=1620943 RepID=A0ABV6M2H7_9ACTN
MADARSLFPVTGVLRVVYAWIVPRFDNAAASVPLFASPLRPRDRTNTSVAGVWVRPSRRHGRTSRYSRGGTAAP